MKHFSLYFFCLFIILSVFLADGYGKNNVYHLPDQIIRKIEKKISESGWIKDNSKVRINSILYHDMGNGKLLIFLVINDYLHEMSNSFLPVIFDSRGSWQSGHVIDGKPHLIVKGPDNAFWLSTQWMIEGTFPTLYRSLDMVNWQVVVLPEERGVDNCFEYLSKICFHNDMIRLHFSHSDGDINKYWVSNLQNSLLKNPLWKEVKHLKNQNNQKCYSEKNKYFKSGRWIREGNTDSSKFIFTSTQKEKLITVIIPGFILK